KGRGSSWDSFTIRGGDAADEIERGARVEDAKSGVGHRHDTVLVALARPLGLPLQGEVRMDEATWATCREPAAMLNFLRMSGRGSGRKFRLLPCAFCRAVAPLLTDERYRSALDVAERYADGLASAGELHDAGRVNGCAPWRAKRGGSGDR